MMQPNLEPIRPEKPAPILRAEAEPIAPRPARRVEVRPTPAAADVALLLATAVLLGAGALLESVPEDGTTLLVVCGVALAVVLLARLTQSLRGR